VCAICGQAPYWNGMELHLRLDHIDGDNHNHQLHNLRWVCPNCDSQLPTFAGRNITTIKEVEVHTCIECGVPISKRAHRCVKCASKHRANGRPTQNDLEDALRTCEGNMCEVGRLFGVSDNAVRKWCQHYRLSTYKQHWTKCSS
jgi:ribosomal protein L40E